MSFVRDVLAVSSVAADKLLKSIQASGLKALDVEVVHYDSSQTTYKVFFDKDLSKAVAQKFTSLMEKQGFSVEDAGLADHMITNPGHHRKYRKFVVQKYKND